jgi:hypothetical protein
LTVPRNTCPSPKSAAEAGIASPAEKEHVVTGLDVIVSKNRKIKALYTFDIACNN